MEWHTFQSFSYAECGFPHSGYRSGSIALYLIHEFLFLNFQIHRISTLSFRLSSIDKSDNMLHSPSGFPSRISCRIIGCDFSSLDTFTYCLLKAVFHKYHAAEFIMRWRLLGAHSCQWFPAIGYKDSGSASEANSERCRKCWDSGFGLHWFSYSVPG